MTPKPKPRKNTRLAGLEAGRRVALKRRALFTRELSKLTEKEREKAVAWRCHRIGASIIASEILDLIRAERRRKGGR